MVRKANDPSAPQHLEFLETIDEPPEPPKRGRGGFAQEVIDRLSSVEMGKWLPVECGIESRAVSVGAKLRKGGLRCSVVKTKIYVQSCVHHWMIGVGGAAGKCKHCNASRTDFAPEIETAAAEAYGRSYQKGRS